MQAWIGHIQGLAFHMEQSGVEVSDQDKILTLTLGLPPLYNPVIINFNSTPSESTEDKAITFPGDGKGGCGAQNTGADIMCFFCDGKGHFKSDCFEEQAWEKLKNKEDTEAAVYFDSDFKDKITF